MGTRHSTRRECLFDGSGGAGDAILATGRSTHRSSGKLRTRWSKVARSHSDRTPASAKPRSYGETSGTDDLQDYSPTKGCSAACQTEVQFVSTMTQTEPDEVLGWKMIDDDRCFFASDVGNSRNFESNLKSHCRMPADYNLHNVRQESLKALRLTDANSGSSHNENYSSVVCNGNQIQRHNFLTDVAAKHLSSEVDTACSGVENFRPENKLVQESSCIASKQWQTTKNRSVDADISKLPEARKWSNSSETRSLARYLMKRDSERSDSTQMSQLDYIICRDLGLSFGSLNSDDMMLDTELDDVTRPNNVRSRHSSVGVYRRQSSSRLMSSKCTALPEFVDSVGHQMEHSDSGVLPQRQCGVGTECLEHAHSVSIESTKNSESAATGDDVKHAVNGCIGLDQVSELSSTEITSRYFLLIVLLALIELRDCICIVTYTSVDGTGREWDDMGCWSPMKLSLTPAAAIVDIVGVNREDVSRQSTDQTNAALCNVIVCVGHRGHAVALCRR